MSKPRNSHAVVLAGDPRTFECSAHTLAPFLQQSDIFVSFWDHSVYSHKVERRVKFRNGPFTSDSVASALSPLTITDMVIEPYVARDWQSRGYNANFLHRQRAGIAMVRKHGPYDSVLFMRPDLWINDGFELNAAARSVERDKFVTIYSDEHTVHVYKKLQDMVFAVHFEDMERAVPTPEVWEEHRTEDWHTFLRNFVIGNGLSVQNVENMSLAVLRPPIPKHTPLSWDIALNNSYVWNDATILRNIDERGLLWTIRAWGGGGVIRAVTNAVEREEKERKK